MKRMPRSLIITLDDRFFKRVVQIITSLIAFYLFLQLLPYLKPVMATLVAAILITTVLDPIVTLLEHRGINRIGAILLVFMVITLLLSLAVLSTAPTITAQIESLSRSLQDKSPSKIVDTAQSALFSKIPLLKSPEIQEKLNTKLELFISEVMQMSFSAAVSIVTSFPYLIVIAFAVFFFLKDGWRIKRAIIEAMPNRYFEISLILVHQITEQIGRYIRGQLIVSSIIGTLSILALTLLDIPYSFFIGVIAGLANMIPYFGPLLGFVLAAAVALFNTPSFGVVLAVAGAFATIQLIDNVLVSPFIVSRSVELHPLAIIICILIGSALMGLWGALLAVPVASVLKVTFCSLKWGLENYKVKERMLLEGA